MQFVPCIRYCGGKRKQSEDIIAEMPHEIKTLFIPFIGGGSVMFQALNSNIQIDKIVATDIYKPLMDLWLIIKDNPELLIDDYSERYTKTMERGESYYDEVVARFNNGKCSDEEMALMFNYISRACIRGNLEYDGFGNFKTKFLGKSRDNIIGLPQFKPIIMRWSACIQDVEFRCESYEDTVKDAKAGDYCFFDPPYVDGNWYRHHSMDYNAFFDILRGLPCDYSVTLNGDKDIYPLPTDCYTEHKYIYYGIKKSGINGNQTGSRDSFWMKHTSEYDYGLEKVNVRQNQRGEGGMIPQVNNLNILTEINDRLTNIEDMLKKLISNSK